MVRRGEIWLTESPGFGRRPVLVLSREAVLDSLDNVHPLSSAQLTEGVTTLPPETMARVDRGLVLATDC